MTHAFIRASLLASVAIAVGAPGALRAQTTPPKAAPAAEAAAEENIIVTGSRIARQNLEAPTPVTTLTAGQVFNSGVTSIGDVLNDLPALRGTYTSANSGRFIGTAGVNFLDLRGLGTPRTLVLVNGRRHVAGTDGSLEVDTNTIPADLLERVDIITGGASSVYGSDAVAGVVNFVLKTNYEGLSLKAQSGISSRGDNQNSFVAGLFGTNFSDGRGNITLSLEYAREDAFGLSDRPTTVERQQFVQTTVDPTGQSSDGIPDNEFFVGVRSLNLTEGGTFAPSFQPGVTAANVPLALRVRALNGQPRLFRFQPNGTLQEADYGTRDFRPLAANSLGGDGSSLRRYGFLTPQIERYAANLVTHFDFNDAVKFFGEAKFVRVKTLNFSSPSFNQTTSATTPASTGSGALTIRLDNPYLTAQAAGIITPLLRAGATSFSLNRNNLDLGVRGEDSRRETFRVVAGFKGELADNLNYEISGNYGQFDIHTDIKGNRLERQLRLSIDAARAADGSIVCRSRLNITNNVVVTGDNVIDSCVPVNLLGDGNVTEAARNYITSPSTFDARVSQTVFSGFMNYNTENWFSLPGGGIGLAVGGEYRREGSRSGYSADVKNGLTFLNAIQDLTKSFSVKEAFGEINLPLFKDVTLIKELSINASVRASDYTFQNTKTIIAWNGGVVYAPVSDIRFRANYSRSVRTPTIGDLFQPLTQNFGSVQDPCDVLYISQGGATRGANCAAAGVPVGFVNTVARAQTIELRSGGNSGLTEEKARSITVGVVLEPRFVPGLAITVDYYNIKINNVIASVTPQQILNNCYDGASLVNIFCPLVFRDPATKLFYANGNGPIGGGVLQSTLNYASRIARGVDAEITYKYDWDQVGKFDLRAVGTYVIQRDNFPFLTEPKRPDQILKELGDPQVAFNIDIGFQRNGLKLDYGLRWLGSQYVNFIEDIVSVGGRAPENPDYSSPNFTGAVMYHDIRVAYDVSDAFEAYVGVDNVGDKLPPLGFTGTGAGSGIYTNRGRYFYAGLKWKIR